VIQGKKRVAEKKALPNTGRTGGPGNSGTCSRSRAGRNRADISEGKKKPTSERITKDGPERASRLIPGKPVQTGRGILFQLHGGKGTGKRSRTRSKVPQGAPEDFVTCWIKKTHEVLNLEKSTKGEARYTNNGWGRTPRTRATTPCQGKYPGLF